MALSPAQSELYAMVSAASEGLGARVMAMDFGHHAPLVLHVDASAAIGVAQRKGLGRIRHLDCQDAVRSKRVALVNV